MSTPSDVPNTETVRSPSPNGGWRSSRAALFVVLAIALAASGTALGLAVSDSHSPTTTTIRSPGLRARPLRDPTEAGGTGEMPSSSEPKAGGAPGTGSGPAPSETQRTEAQSASEFYTHEYGNLPAGAELATYLGHRLAGNGEEKVSLPRAEQMADASPAGAQVNKSSRTITFTTPQVHLVIVASPPSGDMKFRSAGINDPTIVVPAGAHITLKFVNGDSDMAHMWLLQEGDAKPEAGDPYGTSGAHIAAAPPLGDPTSAGQPVETVSFSAPEAGDYHYDCPFPHHAAEGMYGRFTVRST